MKHNAAGIEGLPLRLLIIVIITVVALSIIMLWLGGIGGVKEIKTIESSPEDIAIPDPGRDQYANITVDITIKVFDAKNNKVAGVVVTLDGCSVFTSAKTDSDGEATFSDLDVTLAPGSANGVIEVTAKKSDYKDGQTEIMVYRI